MTLPIQTDGTADNSPVTLDEGAQAFLKKFFPDGDPEDAAKRKPSKEAAEDDETPEASDEETSDDDAETPSEDEETEDEETEDEKPKSKKYADDDNETYVKVKVGDEEHEVAVKDLKRLFGQEKALTTKSQEVAEKRKQLDETLEKQSAAAAALLKRAQDRYKPYADVDFNLAARELEPEQYKALRDEALAAYEDLQFYQTHLNDFMGAIKAQKAQATREAAAAALKELSGPVDKGGIEGWGQPLYDDIRAYAITAGIPRDVVNGITDAWAIRVLHKAMLHDKGSKKGEVRTKIVNKTPKKVVKTSTSAPVAREIAKSSAPAKAMKRLQQTGSTDDAAELFLARWASKASD